MYGDFTRDPLGHAPEVLYTFAQQGRVHLDSDWNALAAGMVETIRRSLDDLLGGSAAMGEGFKPDKPASLDQLTFAPGTYFVDGYRVSADAEVALRDQRWRPNGAATWWPDPSAPALVYLDVWVRNVTSTVWPDIRETALRGPDTTTRGVLTWQLRAIDLAELVKLANVPLANANDVRGNWDAITNAIHPAERGHLWAYVDDKPSPEPCADDEPGGYTGPGNQLYRFEVDGLGANGVWRVRWSRDNASVEWPVVSVGTSSAVIATRPGARPVPNEWLELVDEVTELDGSPRPVVRVRNFDPDTDTVVLDAATWKSNDDVALLTAAGTRLRRWDGVFDIEEAEEVAIERGIRVRVMAPPAGATFRPGDYWLAAARVPGGLIWPDERQWPPPSAAVGGADYRSPAGPVHHLAPLALWTADNVAAEDCRWTAKSLRTP